MKLIRTGTYAVIEGDRELAYQILDPHFSYDIPGAKYAPAFRAKRKGPDGKVKRLWDGRKHLVRRLPKDRLTFPSGLFWEAVILLQQAGVIAEIENKAEVASIGFVLPWAGPTLHPHQDRAVHAVLDATVSPGGVLVMPIGSGKTATAAWITNLYGLKTCFVAPSDFLVQQAIDAFRSYLPGAHITAVGGGQGEDLSGQIVIASMATLQARRKQPWFEKFRKMFGLVFFDELHHLLAMAAPSRLDKDGNKKARPSSGSEWRETAIKMDAPIKIGLTATLDDDPAVNLWARAICGPILYQIEMKPMIEAGYLSPGVVRFLRHEAPVSSETEWTRSTYRDGVVQCTPRNKRLAVEAADLAIDGHRVVVDVAQVGHTRAFADLLRAHLPPGKVVVLTASASDDERRKAVQDLKHRRIWVIVGTLLGEGVDIPELSVVVNLEGGKDSASATQRLRNLRKHPDKPEGIVIESFDTHHPWLADSCLKRLQLYRKLGLRVEVEPKQK